jgi:hypothetical protein
MASGRAQVVVDWRPVAAGSPTSSDTVRGNREREVRRHIGRIFHCGSSSIPIDSSTKQKNGPLRSTRPCFPTKHTLNNERQCNTEYRIKPSKKYGLLGVSSYASTSKYHIYEHQIAERGSPLDGTQLFRNPREKMYRKTKDSACVGTWKSTGIAPLNACVQYLQTHIKHQ